MHSSLIKLFAKQQETPENGILKIKLMATS